MKAKNGGEGGAGGGEAGVGGNDKKSSTVAVTRPSKLMNPTFVRHCRQLINNCPHAWLAIATHTSIAPFGVPCSKQGSMQANRYPVAPICYANHFVASHRLTFSLPCLLSSVFPCFSLTFPFAYTFSCPVFYLCAHCVTSRN